VSTQPLSPASILPLLPKARLVEIGRELGIPVPTATKDAQVQALTGAEGMELARPTKGRGRLVFLNAKRAEEERLATPPEPPKSPKRATWKRGRKPPSSQGILL
jgi:hypothetical protein